MSSKQTKPAVLIADTKPQTISLVGHTHRILAQVISLARQGYTSDTSVPVNVFPMTGQIDLTLILGNPEKEEVEEAEKSMAEAIVLERYTAEQQEKVAASQLAEEVARAAKKAEITAAVAAQSAVLKKLQAELAKA